MWQKKIPHLLKRDEGRGWAGWLGGGRKLQCIAMHCDAAGVHLSWKVWKEANVKGKDKLAKCKTSLHTPQHVASYCLCNISGHDSIWTLGHSETGCYHTNNIWSVSKQHVLALNNLWDPALWKSLTFSGWECRHVLWWGRQGVDE